jgi:hypothetical protein
MAKLLISSATSKRAFGALISKNICKKLLSVGYSLSCNHFLISSTPKTRFVVNRHMNILKSSSHYDPFKNCRFFSSRPEYVLKDDFTTAMENIFNKLEQMDKKSDQKFVILEKQIKQIDEKFDEKFFLVEKQIKHIEEKFVLVEKQMDKMGKDMKTTKRMVAQIASGLGAKFEKFNASWIKTLLQARGYPSVDLLLSRKEIDMDREIRHDSTLFEVDVMCVNPFMVAEVTTFLREDEIPKIERFVKIVKLLRKRYGDGEAFFITLAMDNSILGRVKSILEENKITFIIQYE